MKEAGISPKIFSWLNSEYDKLIRDFSDRKNSSLFKEHLGTIKISKALYLILPEKFILNSYFLRL